MKMWKYTGYVDTQSKSPELILFAEDTQKYLSNIISEYCDDITFEKDPMGRYTQLYLSSSLVDHDGNRTLGPPECSYLDSNICKHNCRVAVAHNCYLWEDYCPLCHKLMI